MSFFYTPDSSSKTIKEFCHTSHSLPLAAVCLYDEQWFIWMLNYPFWPYNSSSPYTFSLMKAKYFPTWKENERYISTLLLAVFLYEVPLLALKWILLMQNFFLLLFFNTLLFPLHLSAGLFEHFKRKIAPSHSLELVIRSLRCSIPLYTSNTNCFF